MLKKQTPLWATALGITLLAGTATFATPAQAQTRHRVSLSSGTVIPVKLDNELNSQDVHKGDSFIATVNTDSSDGSNILPAGTKIDGVVRDARAKDEKNPGTLDLDFTRIVLPDGRSYSINGTPIGLDSKSVTRKNGRIVAKKGSKGPNRLTYVGIGAGAGLLVNILAHRKGTLLDTLIGAGLGYGAGSLIKGGKEVKDVDLKAGTKMGVSLNNSVAIAR